MTTGLTFERYLLRSRGYRAWASTGVRGLLAGLLLGWGVEWRPLWLNEIEDEIKKSEECWLLSQRQRPKNDGLEEFSGTSVTF